MRLHETILAFLENKSYSVRDLKYMEKFTEMLPDKNYARGACTISS